MTSTSGVPQRVREWAQTHLGADIVGVEAVEGGRTDTISMLRLRNGAAVILRHLAPGRWGEVGHRHVVSEAIGCRLAAGSGLPVPRLIASDPDAAQSGAYANLTSWLPGRVRLDPLGKGAIDALAGVAATLHSIPVPPELRPRPYAFWVPDDLRPPAWAGRTGLWERAIEIFAAGPPGTPAGLIHRDFHPDNMLWQHDAITGVIDWAETSWGPPDLDVAHCYTNFAMLQDLVSAEAFVAAYRAHGGTVETDEGATRFWAVSDILGFLPDPAEVLVALLAVRPELTARIVQRRLEDLLARVLEPGS